MKDFNCKYWVLNNDDEANKLRELIGDWQKLDYAYPYIVGKEGSFTFQEKGAAPIKPYVSERQNRRYVYVRQEF